MLVKNCLFIGMITLLSVSLAMADDPPAEHPATGEELVIDLLRGTPDAIDGDLSDWELDALIPAVLDTEEQLFSGQSTWDGPDDSSGKFYMLWDDENIYMAVVMKDDVVTSNKSDGSIWNADGIEVFFATTFAVGGHDEHYQYGFDFKEQTWNWDNMDGGGQSPIDYLQVACTTTGDGYICEAAIEYGEMLSLDWDVGSPIGFHPVIDDIGPPEARSRREDERERKRDEHETERHLLRREPPFVVQSGRDEQVRVGLRLDLVVR